MHRIQTAMLDAHRLHRNPETAMGGLGSRASTSYPALPISFASILFVATSVTFCMVLSVVTERIRDVRCKKLLSAKMLAVAFFSCLALHVVDAQEKGSGDLDAYKWRITAMWWYSHPSGSFNASSDKVSFDIQKDFGFGSYSTFTGAVDWHFKRKHHFTFQASPVYSSRSSTLTRDITFRGVTYHVGTTAALDLNSLAFAPGYQWDFMRRRQGYLALATAIDLLNTTGTITGTGSVNDVSATRTASGSVLAPLPVLGARGRWYMIPDSDRFSIDGSFQGMYFFGYGDFIYARGKANVKLHRHLDLTAGYQMGTRLKVKGTSNRVGLRLTQTGPVVGLEASF